MRATLISLTLLLISTILATPILALTADDWNLTTCSYGRSRFNPEYAELLDGDINPQNYSEYNWGEELSRDFEAQFGEGVIWTKRINPGTYKAEYFNPQMGHSVGYTIYLPYGEDDPYEEYPVIFSLHGVNGDECNYLRWDVSNDAYTLKNGQYSHSAPNLIADGKVPKTIFILPNGGAGLGYIDRDADCAKSDGSGVNCAESNILELIKHIDNTYRTIKNPKARGIEGFSMGGIGTSERGLKHADKFCSIIPMASASDRFFNSNTITQEQNELRLVTGLNDSHGLDGFWSFFPNEPKPPAGTNTYIRDGIPIEVAAIPNMGHNVTGHADFEQLNNLEFHWNCFRKHITNSPPPSINPDLNQDTRIDILDINTLIQSFASYGYQYYLAILNALN